MSPFSAWQKVSVSCLWRSRPYQTSKDTRQNFRCQASRVPHSPSIKLDFTLKVLVLKEIFYRYSYIYIKLNKDR